MSACARVRASLDEYAAETLSAQVRREVRTHLGTCADCRRAAGTVDPTLLFASVPEESVGADEIASILSAVKAGIAIKESERRLAGVSRPAADRVRARRGRVAAVAALVVATLGLPSQVRSPQPPARAAGVRRAPAAGFAAAEGPAAKAPAGATVYDWNPGGGEPRVVWIVDGSLDI